MSWVVLWESSLYPAVATVVGGGRVSGSMVDYAPHRAPPYHAAAYTQARASTYSRQGGTARYKRHKRRDPATDHRLVAALRVLLRQYAETRLPLRNRHQGGFLVKMSKIRGSEVRQGEKLRVVERMEVVGPNARVGTPGGGSVVVNVEVRHRQR